MASSFGVLRNLVFVPIGLPRGLGPDTYALARAPSSGGPHVQSTVVAVMADIFHEVSF